MSLFASRVVASMRSNLQEFDDHPLSIAVWLSRAQNSEAVVEAFPLLLLNEDDKLVDCLDHCIHLITRFSEFNLKDKVRLLRTQRG